MYIIDGNNEVVEIKDSSVIERFTNLKPDGEPLVVSGFENGIRLEDVVEFCVYGGELRISKSEDESADLEIEILHVFNRGTLIKSVRGQIDQVRVFLCWEEVKTLPECMWYMKNLNELRVWSREITSLPDRIGNLSNLCSLDLHGTKLIELPESIGKLKSLSILNLSETRLLELPESIGKLSSLSSLDLWGTKLTELPESIGKLRSLRSLDLRGTKLTELPESIGNLSSLSSLDLGYSGLKELPESIGNLSSLSSLDLGYTRLKELTESTGNLSRLSSLDLSGIELTELPESIGNLSSLSSLNLGGTKLTDLPESIENLSSLSSLNLGYSGLKELPESIGNLSSLSRLDLRGTKLTDLPESIENLSRLSSLDLSGIELTELPESIGNLSSLSSLYLSFTKLTELPESIGNIKSLQDLDLRYLNLNAIPKSLLNLQLEFRTTYDPHRPGIQIEGLTLRDQPIEIFSQSRDLILAYYESQERVPINECKVIFLGDGGAGKSLIIDRLMKNGEPSPNFDGESTPGIKITSKEYQIKGDKIELHFWDFGGQAIMHSMHRLFLTNRTLYVVVTNARDNKANDQAWYWIRNIKSFAKGAPVLLLINQKDQNPSANINETGLRKEYPQIKGVSIVSAKEDTTEEFNKLICDEICKTVSEMESVHTPFPKSWHLLMDDLQEMKTDYIDSKEFREKCKDKGIDIQQDILDRIISWYQDLGVCFYSRKRPAERKYMVLKPKWLLNALYILSFNGRKYAKNGIIREEDIYKLICEPVPDKDIKKVWSDISYEPDEIQYIINVLQNFNLVYKIDSDRFFVPMLCDENEPKVIGNFETEDAIHVSFKYEYLPENVLHRLMVLRGFELNRDLVWKTGAVLEFERCGWQALARSKDNCLDVYAKASDQETHPINSYLDIIRETVYRINSDFGLEAKEYITYSKDEKKEEFLYKYLEGSKKKGQKVVYSTVFDTLLNIDDIIGAITSPSKLKDGMGDKHIQELLSKLTNALLELQGDSHYFDANENACNSFVRSLLKSAGYVCMDQTLRGVGATGKGDGELDIVIQDRDRGNDIAIFEALKLTQKSFAKSDQQYLTDHIKKLLDNYNPTGLKNLLLVSYVSWDKDKFNGLASKYMSYIKNSIPEPYEVIISSMPEHLDTSFLRCYKAAYDYGGITMYIYHFIVRVSR